MTLFEFIILEIVLYTALCVVTVNVAEWVERWRAARTWFM